MNRKSRDVHEATPENASGKPAQPVRDDPFLMDTMITEESRMITAHR